MDLHSLRVIFLIGVVNGLIIKWNDNRKISENFGCTPRQKSLKLSEIIATKNGPPDEFVIPRKTIVHRCESDTGTCADMRYTCAMKTAETVMMQYYVNNGGMVTLPVLNHSRCVCVPENLKK